MAAFKAVANPNNPVTLKGSVSVLKPRDMEGQPIRRDYVGVTLFGCGANPGPDWALMGAELYCLEPMEWPEDDAFIEGIVIKNHKLS